MDDRRYVLAVLFMILAAMIGGFFWDAVVHVYRAEDLHLPEN